MLIQDADFEYDLDDYDALLEPIVQRRTSFVLGSRSLGLDDWKVRRFARSRVKAFLMNVAQLVFARTFNVLYQQRVTDVNTMFKVFRRECIEGVEFARHAASASTSSSRACSSRTATARWRSRSTTSRAASTRARRSTS